MRTARTSCRWNRMSFAAPQRAIYEFTVPEMQAVPGRPSTGGCRKKGHTKRYYGMPCRQIPLTRRAFILEREAERSTDREMKERAGRKLWWVGTGLATRSLVPVPPRRTRRADFPQRAPQVALVGWQSDRGMECRHRIR